MDTQLESGGSGLFSEMNRSESNSHFSNELIQTLQQVRMQVID